MRAKLSLLVVLAVIALGSCQRQGESHSSPMATPSVFEDSSADSGIAKAIRAHLAHNSNLNPSAFDTEVKRVNIRGDRADAEVEFHVKNGPGVMQLTYVLTKQDGAWSVVESTPTSSNFSHPQLNGSQAAQPGMAAGGDSSVFRTLDNFRSGGTISTPKLPPGHPPVVQAPGAKKTP